MVDNEVLLVVPDIYWMVYGGQVFLVYYDHWLLDGEICVVVKSMQLDGSKRS